MITGFLVDTAAALFDPFLLVACLLGGLLPRTWPQTVIAVTMVCAAAIGWEMMAYNPSPRVIGSMMLAGTLAVLGLQYAKRTIRQLNARHAAQ
jgi:hypothetical protein